MFHFVTQRKSNRLYFSKCGVCAFGPYVARDIRTNYQPMLFNYLKLATRILLRNPLFTIINLLGLSIGFVSFFALWEYGTAQLNADNNHKDHDRIIKVGLDWQWTDDGKNWGKTLIGSTGVAVAYRAAQDFPEVQEYVRIIYQDGLPLDFEGNRPGFRQMILRYEDNFTSIERGGVFSDPNLFLFFNIPLLHGEAASVLTEKNSIVLSEKMSKRFFGDMNPVDALLIMNEKTTLKVTGVFADIPASSHLKFDFVISNTGFEKVWNEHGWPLADSYVKLDHHNFDTFISRLNQKSKSYFSEAYQAFPNIRLASFYTPLNQVKFDLDTQGETTKKSKPILIGLLVVSFLILFMAVTNYLNLTISRLPSRVKEISMRKLAGASMNNLMSQFLFESLIFNAIAVGMAVTFLQFLYGPAAEFLDIHVPRITDISISSLGFYLLIFFCCITVSGFYPVLQARRRSLVSLIGLKHQLSGNRPVPLLLTTFQYTITVVLIFFGLIIHRQLNLVLNRDPGFITSNILFIDPPVIKPVNYTGHLDKFQNKSEDESFVQDCIFNTSFIDLNLRNAGSKLFVNTDGYGVEEDFLSFFNIPLLAGRNFIADDREDVLIVSEFATQRLGLKSIEDAIGRHVDIATGEAGWKEVEIVGVIADLHLNPLFKTNGNSEAQTGRGHSLLYGSKHFPEIPMDIIQLKFRTTPTAQQLKNIGDIYEDVFPGNVFSANFWNDMLSLPYKDEKFTRNQISFFIFIAIGIACLGLLGMLSNKVVEKTREIGIRKALGANLQSIWRLLLESTFIQLLLSVIIGIPIAYYLSSQYLQKYAVQISIDWWYYFIPCALLCSILFATVSFTLLKVARTNPVDALRCDQ